MSRLLLVGGPGRRRALVVPAGPDVGVDEVLHHVVALPQVPVRRLDDPVHPAVPDRVRDVVRQVAERVRGQALARRGASGSAACIAGRVVEQLLGEAARLDVVQEVAPVPVVLEVVDLAQRQVQRPQVDPVDEQVDRALGEDPVDPARTRSERLPTRRRSSRQGAVDDVVQLGRELARAAERPGELDDVVLELLDLGRRSRASRRRCPDPSRRGRRTATGAPPRWSRWPSSALRFGSVSNVRISGSPWVVLAAMASRWMIVVCVPTPGMSPPRSAGAG